MLTAILCVYKVVNFQNESKLDAKRLSFPLHFQRIKQFQPLKMTSGNSPFSPRY
jgi:hypothetical protein